MTRQVVWGLILATTFYLGFPIAANAQHWRYNRGYRPYYNYGYRPYYRPYRNYYGPGFYRGNPWGWNRGWGGYGGGYGRGGVFFRF